MLKAQFSNKEVNAAMNEFCQTKGIQQFHQAIEKTKRIEPTVTTAPTETIYDDVGEETSMSECFIHDALEEQDRTFMKDSWEGIL